MKYIYFIIYGFAFNDCNTKASALMFLRPRGRQSVAFSREAPLCAYVLLFLCLPR